MSDLTQDTRPRITLTKAIHLEQLSKELGVGLCASDTELAAAEDAGITQEQLELAYAAHVPDPNYGVSAEVLRAEQLTAKKGPLTVLEAAELAKLAAKGVQVR